MSDKSRRGFLKTAAGLAGATMVAPVLMAGETSKKGGAYLDYAEKKIGTVSNLKKSGQLDFSYPDADSPCLAVHVNGEVKAYSTLCTHKGCPTMYRASEKTFVCPCHFSKFDAEKDCQMTIGQATDKLPEILVRVEGDSIIAYGVDGLIFGRLSNTLN